MEVKKVEIGKVAEVIMGQSPSSESFNVNGRGLPFYQGVTDFGEIFPTPRMYCENPKKTAEPNDILLSVRAPIGRINIANNLCATGRGIAIIRAKKKSDQTYLKFAIESIYWYWDTLEGSGAIFSNAKKGDIIKAEIPWGDEDFRELVTKLIKPIEGMQINSTIQNEKLHDLKKSIIARLMS
jgi:type I restriction enzyme S subunit